MMLDLEDLLGYAYRSLTVWGDDAQRTMAMGEAAEFIDALAKHARNRATPAQVVDEAADAIIVAAVAVALAGGDSPALMERIAFKMDRTRDKMERHAAGVA
jgi:NTP pyrophosphatase (non-canonical NTP hydrolase)